uniref:Beta-defensin-like domain-containing protein n=1 Tax=Pelusios castaneus TaxID=367368 RepID=A0A8C8RT57_9SAUR
VFLSVLSFFINYLTSLLCTADGQRETRYLNHCLQRGGTCRYDDCDDGEEQIGTCYHHTMVCYVQEPLCSSSSSSFIKSPLFITKINHTTFP